MIIESVARVLLDDITLKDYFFQKEHNELLCLTANTSFTIGVHTPASGCTASEDLV